jgi:hypothetical protein
MKTLGTRKRSKPSESLSNLASTSLSTRIYKYMPVNPSNLSSYYFNHLAWAVYKATAILSRKDHIREAARGASLFAIVDVIRLDRSGNCPTQIECGSGGAKKNTSEGVGQQDKDGDCWGRGRTAKGRKENRWRQYRQTRQSLARGGAITDREPHARPPHRWPGASTGKEEEGRVI